MKRTEMLQEVRKMRFEEIYGVGQKDILHRKRQQGCLGYVPERLDDV